MPTTRILVVDDDDAFRQRVKAFFAPEADMEVVAETSDGEEAITKAQELKPDVVLMDVRMPGFNGVSATRKLREEVPEVKVIMLSVFDLPEYREAAMVSGASGYVVKKSMIEALLPEIRRVCPV
ncbi:MAG: response regulator transcription factor [Anaerolineae bacterium]|nr:response regulator transcription factor [Anaerolineae bacterium]